MRTNKVDEAIIAAIKKYLADNKMTIKDFSNKVGVSRTAIHRMFRHYYRANGPTLVKIQDAIGLTVSIRLGTGAVVSDNGEIELSRGINK